MSKPIQSNHFSISGIFQNNLKTIDFESQLGEIVLVCGISGSGKSTLVNEVVVRESLRQLSLKRKSGIIYDYAVRPDFDKTTRLPPSISVTQRALTKTQTSTFATRSRIKGLIEDIFSSNGKIFYKDREIKAPSIDDIFEYLEKFHPKGKLYVVLSHFEKVNKQLFLERLKRNNITDVIYRDEKNITKSSPISKLPSGDLSKIEILANLTKQNFTSVYPLAKSKPVLFDNDIEIDFEDKYFDLSDGTIFRKPSSPSLFSTSTATSLSGRCRKCDGSGRSLIVNIDSAINYKNPINKGLLNVGLSKSGRYLGFKFLPNGLATLIKKSGIDINKSYSKLNKNEQEIIQAILKDKIQSNQNDEFAKKYIVEANCSECEGSGFGYQTRSVLVEGKSFDYFLSRTSKELFEQISTSELDGKSKQELEKRLMLIQKLSIDHIALDRPTATMSSGEAQRLKLLDVLLDEEYEKIIVLDEPSSNLHFKDNLNIIDLILDIRRRNNCIIIVDHNPLFKVIADRVIEIGPGAGQFGGHVSSIKHSSQLSNIKYSTKRIKPKSLAAPKFKTVKFTPKHNIKFTSIKFPINTLNVIIGASGSGKSTLVLDLIYNALVHEGTFVEKLDSKQPGNSSSSIVATYIDCFDSVRKLYAKSSAPLLTESDFSFNSTGACMNCNGSGKDEDRTCGVCFGNRYKSEVTLFKVDDYSIVDILKSDIQAIDTSGQFSFLNPIIQLFEDLSLTHISLGRSTNTLSGGELQRLKLAKFILKHQKNLSKTNAFIILDEPCRGLDHASIEKLYLALCEYLDGSTVLVIEHNPEFIYRCDYVIDLGDSKCDKKSSDIVCDFIDAQSFPSLTHNEVFAELKRRINPSKKLKEGDSKVSSSSVTTNSLPEGKLYRLIHPFFIKQENFKLENAFKKSFKISQNDKNVSFHQSKNAMIGALSNENEFFFNPLICYLEKFRKVPISIYDKVINSFNKSSIVSNANEWGLIIKASSFEEAFVRGAGVVITADNRKGQKSHYHYNGTRLISLLDQVVDRVNPSSFAFNLHTNACEYCHGYGFIKSYPFEKWLNKKYSILDAQLTHLNLNKVMPKTTIAKFKSEGLFDFSTAVNKLSDEEFNILLYGFKSYKFLKNGKSGLVEDDFFEWRGLNSYIYNSSGKLSPKSDLNQYLEWTKCPFCSHGFRAPIKYYIFKGASLPQYISQYGA